MKAMVHDRYGSPDVLELRDIDRPTPKPDEVLLRVHAAGLDQGVWHMVSGMPYVARLALGLRKPRRQVPGMDVAGVVESVGARVSDFKPGDEVFGTARGSFAEYALAKTIVPKPASVTFEQAAAVPVSACTALTALRGVEVGQRIMIIGAGGGVGSYAVQLATVLGASVTAVCGPRKAELVRSLGATEVIDYTREQLTGEYDMLLDIAGGRPLRTLRRLLARRGTLVLVGSEEGNRWITPIDRTLAGLVQRPFTSQRFRAPISIERQPDLARLSTLLTEGKLTPAIDRTFSLGDVPAAITYLREGHVRGKIVVTP